MALRLQGKEANEVLRKKGRIPGLLVGDDLPFVPLSFDGDALDALVRHDKFMMTLIELDIGGERVRVLPWQVRLF